MAESLPARPDQTTPRPALPDFGDAPPFAALVDMACADLTSERSERVYRVTYGKWQAWAEGQGLDPRAVNVSTVGHFLDDQRTKDGGDLSKATKQRQLSALRKLARALKLAAFLHTGRENPAYQAALESLAWVKVRGGETTRQSDRKKRALSPKEADRLLTYWTDLPADGWPPEVIRQRNQAIVATLLLTGVRRAELAALIWGAIDFENAVIHVAHGKGDKARDVAIYGGAALAALRAWQLAQPTGYRHVFTAFTDKAGTFGPDRPMTAQAIYDVFRATAEAALGTHLTPHDARRTLLTELLATGTPLHDAQAQAGHARGDTTLGYAQAVDARTRRRQGRVRYG
jgi:integrase